MTTPQPPSPGDADPGSGSPPVPAQGTTFSASVPPPRTAQEGRAEDLPVEEGQTEVLPVTQTGDRTRVSPPQSPGTSPEPSTDETVEMPTIAPTAAGGPPETEPPAAPAEPPALRPCPSCGAEVEDRPFCEQCGADLHDPAAAAPSARATPGARDGDGLLVLGQGPVTLSPMPAPEPEPVPGDPCPECGGQFMDGYCANCGAPAPDPRAHHETSPALWLAGVCDIGVRHAGNQDAMALAEVGPDAAALVVCDGVSSAARSEEASQAAADAALVVLTGATSRGVGVRSSVVPALTARLQAAADAASDAVAEVTGDVASRPESPSSTNPSCTFVAAVVDGDDVVVGSVGDSRAYWLPDDGEALRLTTDDSWAEEQVRLGASRDEAERGPHAHTITRWLGIDAPDHAPAITPLAPSGPGWLLLCSDGLWNYASEPADLARVVAEAAGMPGVDDEPSLPAAHALARRLVDWANGQGGHDNITVALARLGDRPDAEGAPNAAERPMGDEDPLGQNPTIVIPESSADAQAPGPIEENATHG